MACLGVRSHAKCRPSHPKQQRHVGVLCRYNLRFVWVGHNALLVAHAMLGCGWLGLTLCQDVQQVGWAFQRHIRTWRSRRRKLSFQSADASSAVATGTTTSSSAPMSLDVTSPMAQHDGAAEAVVPSVSKPVEDDRQEDDDDGFVVVPRVESASEDDGAGSDYTAASSGTCALPAVWVCC